MAVAPVADWAMMSTSYLDECYPVETLGVQDMHHLEEKADDVEIGAGYQVGSGQVSFSSLSVT